MKNSVFLKGRSILMISLLCVIFSFTESCSKDNAAPANTTSGGNSNPNEVLMQGKSFSPGSITVPVGTQVTWRNSDIMAHTVTSDNSLFDSGNIAVGASYSFTFTAKGTYAYHCVYHAGMTGTVVVN